MLRTALLLSLIAPLATLVRAEPATAGSAIQRSKAEKPDASVEAVKAALEAHFQARAEGEALAETRAALEDALGQAGGGLADPDLLEAVLASVRIDPKAKAKAGKVRELTYSGGSFLGSPLRYAVRLPRDYERGGEPGGRPWPLVVSIPDAEEGAARHLRERWTNRDLLEGAIILSPEMPADEAQWDRVMVDGAPGGLAAILTSLRLVTEELSVDPNRIVIVGTGAGIGAALGAGSHAPQLFAGVACQQGDGGSAYAENFATLPVYFGGASVKAKEFQAECERLGFEHCTIEVAPSEAATVEWMLVQSRDPFPSEVRLRVGEPFPTRSYWLRVAPNDPDARAKARIETDQNAVHIDTQGVSLVTLYLSDRMVDLDRPIDVFCNGVPRTVSVKRSLSQTIELILDGTSDPGAVYVAELVIDARGAPLEGDGAAAATSLLPLDPSDSEGHLALGHVQAHGHWFMDEARADLFDYLQDSAKAEARGWAERDGLYWQSTDVARLSKGERLDFFTGHWSTSKERRKHGEDGVRQDALWVPKEALAHLQKGEWHLDGEWLSAQEADRRHTRVETPWELMGLHAALETTVDRATAERALSEMATCVRDLERTLGVVPALPLEVVLLRDEEQFDRYAFGDPDGLRGPHHVGRQHVIHNAVFAESRYRRQGRKSAYAGAGVGLWDVHVPNGDAYGRHSARLAYALSWIDAIDPSRKATKRAAKKGITGEYFEAFSSEKKLPEWLRVGAAVYVERFFHDDTVELTENPDADRWWARDWSLTNLESVGGMGEAEAVFSQGMDPDDREGSRAFMLRAGALMSFMLDGDCEAVSEAHAAMCREFKAGRLLPKHTKALERAIIEHAEELREFAGE